MSDDLEVRYGARRVGILRADEERRFVFRYIEDWLRAPDAFPVSIMLPLQPNETVGGGAHAFFANLLPEGGVRHAVCRRLGISEGNDMELLRAIGGECAGALSIVTSSVSLEEPEPEYEELSVQRLQQLASDDDRVVPLLIGGPQTRLSLAGAQDKIPVAVLNGNIHLPLNGSPSTHILKLPNARYPHLPQNEAFILGLARHCELDAVRADVLRTTKPHSLLVERYDRRRSESRWPATRVHQEDFCQALGLLPAQKYEQEGGPTLVQSVAVVRAHASEPLRDLQRLLRWQVFNAAVGNADGHGKNLSILYGDDGPRLAPFYDLVSTREYSSLDRLMAMSVGGRRNADELGIEQWAALADHLDMRDRAVIQLVRATLEMLRAHLGGWVAEFRQTYGRLPVLQTLPPRIERQIRRLERALEAPRRRAKAKR